MKKSRMNKLVLGLSAAVCVIGCDKGQTTSSTQPPAGTGSAQTSAPSAASTGTPVSTPGSPTVSEMVATYNAVSDVEGTSLHRHQALILNADGTAELDTTITDPSKPATGPKSTDTGTGTYAVKGTEITVTFTTKDGKPIPATDDKRMLKLTAGKADKSLVGEDGRTFERAAAK
jgi:hypothetical protein